MLTLSICLLGIALILSIINAAGKKSREAKKPNEKLRLLEKLILTLTIIVILIILVFITLRSISTGHGPFTSMYEFSISFAWGILVMGVIFSYKYRNIIVNLAGSVLAAALLIFAGTQSSMASPLVPALQNNFLLSTHVISAVIAYGAFTVGFIASIMVLSQKKDNQSAPQKTKTLERMSYHSVIIGFPFMTLVIVLGAIWADVAWGSFWSWDPKETASLVTWLIYAIYLHTRIIKKWEGKKSAVLLIIGFAAVLFTFFGNYIFSGLHSYI